MEVLNDRSFAASSEECHSDLVDICGTSKGGVLAVLSRENDDPCQPGSDSGSGGGVAAGVVVSIFLVGIAAAGVYYKFYMKRGSQSVENKEEDDDEQNDSEDRTKDRVLVGCSDEEATRQCKATAS